MVSKRVASKAKKDVLDTIQSIMECSPIIKRQRTFLNGLSALKNKIRADSRLSKGVRQKLISVLNDCFENNSRLDKLRYMFDVDSPTQKAVLKYEKLIKKLDWACFDSIPKNFKFKIAKADFCLYSDVRVIDKWYTALKALKVDRFV